jgi:O-antigen/teichoic acid export membrane protein
MFVTSISQIFNAIIALITIRMYSELLTPQQMGEAMLALGGMALFDAVFSASINQVVFYYGSKDELKSKVFYIIKNTRKYFVLIAGGLIIATTLSLLLFPSIKVTKWLFIVLGLMCYFFIEPLRSSLFSFLNVISTRNKYGFQVILDAILVFIFTFITLSYKPHWTSLIVGIILARYLAIFTNSLLLKKSVDRIKTMDNVEISVTKKEIFKHMQSVMVMGVLGWISGFADRYIIAGMLNVKQTGYYSVAMGLVGRPYNIVTGAYTAYFKPNLFAAVSDNNLKSIKKTLLYWLLGVLIVGLIGALLFLISGKFIVQLLLSTEFRGHVESILWILALAMTFTIATHAFDNKFLARGLGNKLLKIQLCLSPISLFVIGIGAYYKDVSGVVYGKLISEIIKFIFTGLYLKKLKA